MTHGSRIVLVAFLLAGLGAWLSPRRWWNAAWERAAPLARWLNAETARSRATAFILIWIVGLIPMLHMTYLVRHYAVEVPTLDDWDMAPLIVEAHTGHFNWAHIFAQQQEGRTILPKLIFVLSAANGHWDVRDQMMLSVACCWLTAAGIFILLRRTGLRSGAIAICFWLAVLTVFSLAQYELWIFASGFPSFFPALFLVAGLVVIGANISTTWKFVLCGLVATASSFSLPHGLLAWGLTFPMLLLTRPIPRWRSWLGAWSGFAALCAAVYFWGYRKPADLPTFAPTVSGMEYVRFILEFLGGGLAYAWKYRPEFSAALFGAIQCALFFAMLAYCGARIRDRAFIARTAPWFALALYSLGSAFLAALGRVAYGARFALASRYVTFSIYLTIALVPLIAIAAQEIVSRRQSARSRAWIFSVCAVLVVGYLVPYKVCRSNNAFFLRALSAKDRLAHAAVLFSLSIDTSEIIKKTAYPNSAQPVIERADALDRLQLLHPPLVRTNRLEAIPHESADGKKASGVCESITTNDQVVRARGWAALNAKGRPPDGVLVAYETAPESGWVLCAMSDSFEMRPELVEQFHSMDQLWSGWSATLPLNAFPAKAKLSFWAVDADEPTLYRLSDFAVSMTR
jgi:hypothetical protein